jgi:hypothetical protein
MKLPPLLIRFCKKCMSKEMNKKLVALGGGVVPTDLTNPILFNILTGIPIPKLRRLLRGEVSKEFKEAIKTVLRELVG